MNLTGHQRDLRRRAERDGRDVLLETEGLQLLDGPRPARAGPRVRGRRGRGRRRTARTRSRARGPSSRSSRRRSSTRATSAASRSSSKTVEAVAAADRAHGGASLGHAGRRRLHDQRVRPLLAGARA
ncbi:MAG: hypothetical protein M0C28_16465 [Candidatus Moduliflexus flocculans]|nr:hypothetical protein [Candidatus Moduliflexus flocculans]